MAEDDEHKPHHATARPPPGEEDVYSASTVVGVASDEILAIIRAEQAKGGIPGAPGLPKDLKVEANSDSEIEVPRPAAGASSSQAIKTPVAEPARSPASAAAALTATSQPPKTVEIAPDPEPAPVSTPAKISLDVAPPPVVTSPPARVASTADDSSTLEQGTLHPAVGIVLFFIAVVAVLAALIR